MSKKTTGKPLRSKRRAITRSEMTLLGVFFLAPVWGCLLFAAAAGLFLNPPAREGFLAGLGKGLLKILAMYGFAAAYAVISTLGTLLLSFVKQSVRPSLSEAEINQQLREDLGREGITTLITSLQDDIEAGRPSEAGLSFLAELAGRVKILPEQLAKPRTPSMIHDDLFPLPQQLERDRDFEAESTAPTR